MTFLWLNFGIFNLRGHGDDPLVNCEANFSFVSRGVGHSLVGFGPKHCCLLGHHFKILFRCRSQKDS